MLNCWYMLWPLGLCFRGIVSGIFSKLHSNYSSLWHMVLLGTTVVTRGRHVTTLNWNRPADGCKPFGLLCGDTWLASWVQLYKYGPLSIQNVASAGREVPPHLTTPDVSSQCSQKSTTPSPISGFTNSSARHQLTPAASLAVSIYVILLRWKG